MIKTKRKDFIERTAQKPYGKKAIKIYNDPKAHYKSFRIILKKLCLNSEDKFCEIGCGGGVLLRMALKTVQSAAGIDHSPDMVELSIKNNSSLVKIGKAQVLQGKAEKLPWKSNLFTAAASANMFFFVEEPQKALQEIYRVLKPGGRFAMVTMGNSLLGKLIFGSFYSLRTYSCQKMECMLRCAGFSKVEVKTHWGLFQICYAIKKA